MSTRQRVCRVEQIPAGTSRFVRAFGREIAIFHHNGSFYALDNRCPHQGGPLGEGRIDGDFVLCPWHHWDFHLETGRSRLGADVCVRPYRVVVEDGDLFVESTIG